MKLLTLDNNLVGHIKQDKAQEDFTVFYGPINPMRLFSTRKLLMAQNCVASSKPLWWQLPCTDT